jgi:chemotaxis protein histidine kinase CheA
LQTALENIRILEVHLLALARNPHDQEAMNTVHIAAHSLKGQSLMMQYQQLGTAAYALERFFYLLKTGKHELSPEEVQVVTDAVQQMKASLADIAAHDIEKNLEASTASIQTILSRIITP